MLQSPRLPGEGSLLLPPSNKPSATWGCRNCGAEYAALLDAELTANIRLIRASTINLGKPNARSTPAALLREHTQMQEHQGAERRRSFRYPALIPYAAVAVDAAIVATDEPFFGFTRDLSTRAANESGSLSRRQHLSWHKTSDPHFETLSPSREQCFAMIEFGVVVDSTMPDSILAEAYQKCLAGTYLRHIAILAIACHPFQVSGQSLSEARH